MLKIPKTAGGWRAIFYSFRMANKVGWMRLWKAMTTKNACKTCALGMGGQAGGMRNEAGFSRTELSLEEASGLGILFAHA